MRHKIGTYAFHAVAIVLALVTLYPVFFIYANSLKTNAEISKSFTTLPTRPFLGGFDYIIVDKKAYVFLLNSLFVVLGATAICLSVTVFASYRIARHRVKLGNLIYLFLLLGIILSHHSSIVPIFIILRGFGLINSQVGLMIVFAAWNISITMLILTEFFRSIPAELYQAAIIDGASNRAFIAKILLPLSRAPLATAILLGAVFVWNDLMLPMTLISSPTKKLVSSSLIYFKGQYFADYNLLFSAVAFMILPLVILFWTFQRYFVEGVFAGAIKQ
jgi:raffinose/stachyose/melibiose transport system permease protein